MARRWDKRASDGGWHVELDLDTTIGDGNEDSKGSYSAYDGCSELWREHS